MVRSARAAVSGDETGAESPIGGPLIGVRVIASRNLWRLGPAWAVIGGALASGLAVVGGDAALRLAGAVILADSAWGAVWVPVVGFVRHGAPAPHPSAEPLAWSLPYMQPGGPAARLEAMIPGARWHDLLVAVLLTGGLAALLGFPALLISLAALLVTLWALFVMQWEAQPALPRALLNVGLPWLLGMLVHSAFSPFQADGPALPALSGGGLALGAAFTLLDWGVQRACSAAASRGRWVWLGELAVMAVLVALRLPWTAALVAVLLLPPSWYCLRAAMPSTSAEDLAPRADILGRGGPWWWAAMLVAAIALR